MLQLNRDTLVDADTRMRTIRDFEDRVHTEFATGAIPGFVHLYAGEEASAVGGQPAADRQGPNQPPVPEPGDSGP